MNKQNGVFGKKVIALIISFGFVAGALGVSVAIAAITFSGTSITGDSSFTGISGVVSSTVDVGAGTLSLQTASNSPITAGNGLFTIGGALTVNGAFTAGGPKVALSNLATSTAGNIIVVNASNVPTYVALAGDISTVSATGSVALGASNGNLTTLSAISSIDRSGTITIGNTNGTGITIGRSGQTVTLPGNQLVTGPLLFSATGAVIDSNVAGTLLIGNSTSTGITIGRSGQTVTFPGNVTSTGTFTINNAAAGALTVTGGGTSQLGPLALSGGTLITKHLSATSSLTFGIIASSTCATLTATVTGANPGDTVLATPTPIAGGIDTVSSTWNAWVSSTNTVTVRACNPTITNTASVASQTWRFDDWQH